MPSQIKDNDIIANDFLTDSFDISRLKMLIRSWSRPVLMMFNVATASVVVRIPPPVEPGDAPIHISRMMIITAGNDNAEISTVLYPAERGVAPVKKAVTILPNKVGCAARVLSYSSMKIITKPKESNIRDV